MSDELAVFHSDLTLHSHQVDPYYQARETFFLQIIQEAAGLHAYHRNVSIPHLNQLGMTWLLLRTRLTVHRYPSWPENLHLATWPQKPWKFYFPRVTVVTDNQDRELLRAISQWLVVDTTTRRPVRTGLVYETFDGQEAPFELNPDLGRQKPFDAEVPLLAPYRPEILYDDIDFNDHVNNISYFSWILDSLPATFRNEYKVAEVDISYLSETHRNDQVSVYTTAIPFQGEIRLSHLVTRNDEVQICIAHTLWKARSEMSH